MSAAPSLCVTRGRIKPSTVGAQRMAVMTEEIALKFCELCNWVYESWITHKALFENNENKEDNIGRCVYFTSRLSIVTQEYSLQQIAKLHDRAVQRASTNLTIDYVITFGKWGERKEEVEGIAARLSGLKERIIPARNKILSHNDLPTILENRPKRRQARSWRARQDALCRRRPDQRAGTPVAHEAHRLEADFQAR